MADETIVDSSSTAVLEPPVTETPAGEARAEWLKTGKEPEPAKADAPPKKSSETLPADKAKAVETVPAPDPGSQQEPKPAPGEKQIPWDKDPRWHKWKREEQSLRQENERLKAERAAGMTAAPAEPAAVEGPRRPRIEDFAGKTQEEYDAAQDQYTKDLVAAEVKTAVGADRQERAAAVQREADEKRNYQIETNWGESEKSFLKNHPEINDYGPAIQALMDSGLIPERSYLDQWILGLPGGPSVAYYYSQNPDEILRLGEMNLDAAHREVIRLELSLEKKEIVPVPLKTKVLPKPITEVAAKATVLEDQVEGALRENNFSVYRREQNARELAARRK